ncbi:rhodanese-like domain-containing protein [Maribacter sp. ACAM166]|uniref:rhodanese-like domain-containing protein n=1 Tax=Maribacter sp. ACAM166 TaxID=2508996 RepID=UPI0010FD3E70|nr:rhodanese-like domain-containing protein [Maribacter sp. ACAM166]TLP82744.1 rhodanese-like domain-containing protein [Maribacter sp. ACAM166]
MKSTNNRLIFSVLLLISFSIISWGQDDMDRALKTWNKESIPYIHPENLPIPDSIVYLDTREKEEFDVSHLKNALWVGYSNFSEEEVLRNIPNKAQPIIVYCSIGVRSENIGEKLKSLGYTKILNLYGGIFEWKNQGGDVFNSKNILTDSVHAFSKQWGKLLHEGVKAY